MTKLYNNVSSASAVRQNYSDYEDRGEQLVKIVTLDEVLTDPVNFIKVDTDGFEFEVLRGAGSSLKSWHPALYFEFAPYLIPNPVDGLVWLKELGYEPFLCLTPRGDPIGITGDPDQVVAWTDDRHCDIVACHESSSVPIEEVASTLASASYPT